jgi:hypothetical protein
MKFPSVLFSACLSNLQKVLVSASRGEYLFCMYVARDLMPRNSYGLVTEQKKGSYKYFVDLGDRMEVANVKTVYVDEVGLE